MAVACGCRRAEQNQVNQPHQFAEVVGNLVEEIEQPSRMQYHSVSVRIELHVPLAPEMQTQMANSRSHGLRETSSRKAPAHPRRSRLVHLAPRRELPRCSPVVANTNAVQLVHHVRMSRRLFAPATRSLVPGGDFEVVENAAQQKYLWQMMRR